MGILDFIFRVLVLIVVFFIGVGGIAMKYDTKKLKEENTRLKLELQKARERKIKQEYKKVNKIRGK